MIKSLNFIGWICFFFPLLLVQCLFQPPSPFDPCNDSDIDASDAKIFVSKWKVDADNDSITLPLVEHVYNSTAPSTGETDERDSYNNEPSYNFHFKISWGDSSPAECYNSEDSDWSHDVTHIYKKAGTYEVKIRGIVENWSFRKKANSKDKIISIDNFGDLGWKNLRGAFYESSQLTQISGGDTSGVRDMAFMFYDAINVSTDIANWDTSKVTDMESLFNRANKSNLPLASWNVSRVKNMKGMFSQSYDTVLTIDLNLNNWDIRNVVNMADMFWDTGINTLSIGQWNPEKVEDMSGMFGNIKDKRNVNPDMSLWQTPSLKTISAMFMMSDSANPDFGRFTFYNITSCKDLMLDFQGTPISSENFEKYINKIHNDYLDPNDSNAFRSSAPKNCQFSGLPTLNTGSQNARDKLSNDLGWTF